MLAVLQFKATTLFIHAGVDFIIHADDIHAKDAKWNPCNIVNNHLNMQCYII